ncbi:Transcriptional antiterminator [Bacillus sp. OV194]|uniref:BglG family transcription antiterminator n=1 Tax=Fictibacillus sp. B-59209 TaxID=3024873 RepID=UPI0008E1FC48|nr:BglG family transcription antiterminator [Fictibacillus sp. B-59209]MED2974968.1 BglG family transcription antiterminator [Fictibacillus sp. B-59209]SFE47352.1 Transcriptional antiterminator [Bacillus sp. OV194]
MQLEERPALLLNQLSALNKPTMSQLMDQTNLTKRQITYDLEKINEWLKDRSLPSIAYKRRTWIEVPERVIDYAGTKLTGESFIFTEEERLYSIFLFLFIRKEYISSAHLMSLLKVSKNTVIADVKKANEMISPFLVKIHYTRERGYHLKGTELDKRVLLMNHLTKLFQKPSGKKIIEYLVKKAGYELRADYMITLLQSLERDSNLQFVEERLHQFAHFLQFYYIRLLEKKVIRLHPDEIEILKQDHLIETAKQMIHLLELDTVESEIAYLVIQLLGLSLGNASVIQDDYDLLLRICERLVTEFESKACISFEEKNTVVETLYQHLKPAYYRMKYRIPIHNPLLEQIREEHKELYTIVKELLEPVEVLLNISVPEEEVGFITIHFGALLEKPKQIAARKKRALVVCPSGISSSLMVKHQLESLFSEITIDRTMSLQEFKHCQLSNFDLVFSTVQLHTKKRYFLVKPIMTPVEKSTLLNEVYQFLFGTQYEPVTTKEILKIMEGYVNFIDKDGLKQALSQFMFQKRTNVNRRNRPVLSDLITSETIQFAEQLPDWEEAIKEAAQPLLSKGAIESSYIDAMIENVYTMGPYVILGQEIAIPHARPEMGVNQVGMSFLKLEHPVYFLNDDKHPVSLLFCIAAIDNTTHLQALSQLTKLLSNKDNVKRLKTMKSVEEIMELIQEYSKAV